MASRGLLRRAGGGDGSLNGRRTIRVLTGVAALATWAGGYALAADAPATRPTTESPEVLRQRERRLFQEQELITAKPFSYVFNAGQSPRIVWRDLEEVRRLGADGRLRVRWFDADLNESPGPPARPGRWVAWVEGTAPNGTPMRRAITFYCRPPGFLFVGNPNAPTTAVPPPPLPVAPPPTTTATTTVATSPAPAGPLEPAVWREHQAEIDRAHAELAFRSANDSEAAAVLLAGLSESRPLARPARGVESLAVRNDDHHLALKLKVLGLADRVRPLRPPRSRAGDPAPVLREGAADEAGVRPDARERIEAVCRAWADDTGEPFVTLVARNGVVVTHAAFGRDPATGKPVDLDYRCVVFSITKTVTALLFSQFVDQGLVALDDPVSKVFPDYPTAGPDARRVPTIRQCFTHTSGLTGHGDFGGVRNPHLDNIVLNGIDANAPGQTYAYSGTGFDLAAEAMELLTGKSWRRVYEDHLFAPLNFGDVRLTDAAAGGAFTARELALLAQWMANRGSYGDKEFISPATFDQLLPEPIKRRWPAVAYADDEGIGNHWMRHLRPGAPPNSKRPEDLLFSPRTTGHGSFSACVFFVDLEQGLVVTQVRKQAGPRHGEWYPKFLQAVAEGMR